MRRTTAVRFAALSLLAIACIAGWFGVSRSQQAAPAAAARASQVCLECHSGRDSTLAGTSHWARRDSHEGVDARVACTDCHSGDPRHWEEDPQSFHMSNPARLAPVAEAKACATCHQTAHQQNMLERNVHAVNGVSCSGCHTVHGSKQRALLRQPETGLCLSCHSSVAGEFAKPFRHPVAEGVVRCSECHRTLDQTRREALSLNGTNVCTTCHAEFEGPFPHEHPATLDFSTEEGGCLTCHEAHGSHLARLLRQPYEPPHFQLCSQCHVVPGHQSNPMHGTLWAGKPCSDCHTDIHGSYDSKRLLSESLRSQGCFNTGCHAF